MVSKEKQIDRKKKKVKAYASAIGLDDYTIIFIEKGGNVSHNSETLKGIEQSNFWINRIYDAFKIDPREKTRTPEVLFLRHSLINLLYKSGVPKRAISQAFNQNHTTTLHSIKSTDKWIEIGDPLFMDRYLEIKKYFEEFEKENYYANI